MFVCVSLNRNELSNNLYAEQVLYVVQVSYVMNGKTDYYCDEI